MSRTERRTALVTAAGSNGAFGFVSAVRSRYGAGVRLISADINPAHLVGSASLTDHHVVVPPSDTPEFAEVVQNLCADEHVDLYVPVLDGEVTLAAQMGEAGLLPANTRILAPAVRTAKLCHDKLAVARWLGERGVPTPATTDASEHRWQGDPVFVKPRWGYGSRGASMVASYDEHRSRLSGGDSLVVQELCSPPEVTIDAFCSQRGASQGWRTVCRERLEVRQGVCTKARVFEDPPLDELARCICRLLDLRGLFCIQVMRAAGNWAVIDVNPRMGAGTPITVAAGVDLVGAAFADAVGLPAVELPDLGGERHVVRVYREVVW